VICDYEDARFVFNLWKHPYLNTSNLLEVGGICYAPSNDEFDDDDEIEIASLSGYYIKFLFDDNILDQLDSPEEALADFTPILFTSKGTIRSQFQGCYSAFIITRLVVKKEHRGHKIGSRFIEEAMDIIVDRVDGDCLTILKAYPIADDSEQKITKEQKEKVISFYKKLDFKKFKDYMYICSDI